MAIEVWLGQGAQSNLLKVVKLRMNETLEKESFYNEKRVENEILGSTNRKGVGKTNQCQGMGTEGTERSEGDLQMETATSHGPKESGGEART